MDKIFIRDLNVATTIGVFEWEQQLQQKVIIDVEFATDTKAAAASDDLANTLDYKKICEILTSFIQENHFKLIETLAEQAAQLLLENFDIQWLQFCVRKPNAISNAKEVGVVIERSRESN